MLKALCGDCVRQAFGARSSIVRPGYIVGPLDPTDRFTYWPVHIVRGADTQATWIDEDFLATELEPEEVNFAPWGPMCRVKAGASLTDMTRSVAEGLRSRPLDETVPETLAWHETRRAERRAQLRSGLSPERGAELLAAWHARKPA
jgi:2'-hydroxyisoflavone reductase